jgi:hypothetical protein
VTKPSAIAWRASVANAESKNKDMVISLVEPRRREERKGEPEIFFAYFASLR